MSTPNVLLVGPELQGLTLAAVLRRHYSQLSWTQIKRMIAGRRVQINKEVCLDPARRLQAGEVIETSARRIADVQTIPIVIRHLDEHLVVVEKPAGIATVRHPAERLWSAKRKSLHPTLEDLVAKLIARQQKRRRSTPAPRLRVVHRLDKETSGLVVFARTVVAERGLGKQFHAHTILRRYIAVVVDDLSPQRIASKLVRDRGDRRRGSSKTPGAGKAAVTHVETSERLSGYSLVSCRLETGRTHQIRIHLAELGHPVCGEKVYNRDVKGNIRPDKSGTPRLALHAAELGFIHPVTGASHHWEMPLPTELTSLVERLRSGATRSAPKTPRRG